MPYMKHVADNAEWAFMSVRQVCSESDTVSMEGDGVVARGRKTSQQFERSPTWITDHAVMTPSATSEQRHYLDGHCNPEDHKLEPDDPPVEPCH